MLRRLAYVTGGTAVAAVSTSVVLAGTSDDSIRSIRCEDGTTVRPWSAPTRSENLERLKKTKFDVLVIGGGAVGAGCALDAATRNLSVALVERSDFAAGTSGRSTKLIHGGIRYLENAFKKLDYGSYELVQEALAERAFMVRSAPYMATPLPIMIPLYKWWEVPYMWVGAKVYDLVAGSQRLLPTSYYISKSEALFQFPMLKSDGLKGAIVYYDGQMNDTRMGLSVVLTAAQHGAAVANRVEVLDLVKDAEGKVRGARARDVQTGEEFTIRARAVVNATGPFSDAVRKMDDPEARELIVPAGGVHVVLPDHFSPDKMGLIVPKTKDGRVLFFLPWEGATLSGTTDSETPLTMDPEPTEQEVNFIIEESNRYLAKTVSRKDVRAAWSGIRPLVRDPDATDTASISRSHVVLAAASGLVTVTGGKWTTYRQMAQDAIDKAIETVPELAATARECRTSRLQLIGADRVGVVCNQNFDRIVVTLREEYGLDRDVAEHLMSNYGTRALQIAEIIRNGYWQRKPGASTKRLVGKYPFLEAEVVFAARQEYATSAVDVLARRTRLAFIDSRAAGEVAERVVDIMGDTLKWSKARKQEELKAAHAFLVTMTDPASREAAE